jgi:hypothetical protein
MEKLQNTVSSQTRVGVFECLQAGMEETTNESST